MPRGRPWTPEEDDAIRAAARATRADGTHVYADDGRPAGRVSRLRDVALELGRTPAAVRKRAQRIGAFSYEGQFDLFRGWGRLHRDPDVRSIRKGQCA